MNNTDIMAYAFLNLRRRFLRSFLTVTGIVVAIAAIVSLLSIGLGFDAYVRDQFRSFGSDTLFITAGSPRSIGSFVTKGKPLTEEDAAAIEKLPFVQKVSPTIVNRGFATFQDENSSVTVIGTSKDFFTLFNFNLMRGRWYGDSETGVAVIGIKVWNETFKKKVNVGSTLIIDGKKYVVVGILNKSSGTGVFSPDSLIFLPYDTARSVFPLYRNNTEVTRIFVQVKNADTIDVAEEEIKRVLRKRHKVDKDNEDFTVSSSKSFLDTISSITTAITAFLGGIAAISLLVGGIGIANTMFMAVLERTSEIGLLKSLGASNRLVLNIFLVEAGLLGLVGGVFGCIIGALISMGVGSVGGPTVFGKENPFTIPLLIGALLFSCAVGMISGYLPAKRAAQMEPVDALRNE